MCGLADVLEGLGECVGGRRAFMMCTCQLHVFLEYIYIP